MKIINERFSRSVILWVVLFSILLMCGCVAPLENLYEPKVETHLTTLTYEGQRLRVTGSDSSRTPEITYRVNRPIKDFVNRLQPKGNIVCKMDLIHNVGGNYYDLHESILVFDIESLDETGVLKPISFPCSSDMKKMFSPSVWPWEGKSMVSIKASFVDQEGKRHRGRVSNLLLLPTSVDPWQ